MKQRILGIDPGLQRTGFGLIDQDGARLRYVSSGVIKTESRAGLAQRIQTIVQGIASISHEAQPDCAAVEIVFVNVNPQSTLLLGQARGAALAALVLAQLPVHEYTALQVKQATVGYGKAKKEQVQDMVMRLLQLPSAPQSDAADALACAITHAHSAGRQIKGGRMKLS
ncbi:MAG: crossover junction endodeoxyribonuclease RuvC [Burkholderiales bacterium]|jgi:crossover junction endodeoxyribonuclease RuvC|nr:crossover junction endodeoxyribonuclease RuvC [Burkholderiales bacterium]MCA3155712.1 crossover junction endodeoxyribonuclease RuvC [Burkholderiales bacterium]MCA3157433.1 crossover junction endodeoxyribonuclease RuvC [Burkholderiales bacterium]MCA3159768.1 crossover junction endodeoxyribonuclease RuvC [Burkholderiales bacterium]MCA3161074.1 crossover junction endodeoxyribonuclease RuvC [Burkholderiales bacterium]